MSAKRARLYDALALLTIMVVVFLDRWTKELVVERLSLGREVPFPIFGHNLAFKYTQNSGAAFSMLKDNAFLVFLIIVAVGVVGYLYSRIWNSGPLIYKLIFGLIIGGALGNLLDRAIRGGYVVDFISFRIPEIGFYFAIFNVADICISIGVMLLFVLVLFGSMNHMNVDGEKNDTVQQSTSNSVDQEPAYTVKEETSQL